MMQTIDFEIVEFSQLAKPPKELYFIGNTNLLMERKITIVGTRHPNTYTKRIVAELATKLSIGGFVIVSGAALGVDAIAHQNASQTNTIAVVANGLDIRYPATNENLIRNIEQHGLMLSTFAPKIRAQKYSFVQRNEIVSALGEVVIIAEADLESGSLTTAKFAQKQNKPLFVLPHRIGESLGTQALLARGVAKAIYDIDAFIASLGVTKTSTISDPLLDFCKHAPLYEEAFAVFGQKLFEYELFGKIKIENGRCLSTNL